MNTPNAIQTGSVSPFLNLLPLVLIIFLFFIIRRAFINKKAYTSEGVKKIKETKCTCQACGNIWYYGKREAREVAAKNMENCGSSMSNAGSDMMCCGGCLPAAFIPKEQKQQVKDLNKCPKCNSSAIKKEEVTHEV